MPYTTLEKIIGQISEATVVQLTDDDGTGIVDTGHVDEAIANADSVIDGFCAGRYLVPFDTALPIIAKCSLDMAIYNLYARRVETMPEVRDKNNANALKLLALIADGKVKLGSAEVPAAPEASRTATATSQPRQFTRESMRGY